MSNVSVTPYGNSYQKTSTGKKVGLLSGTLAGGVAFHHFMKECLKDDVFVRQIAENLIDKSGPNLNPDQVLNTLNRIVKRLPKFSSIIGAAMIGGVGLAIGAVVDKVKNHNRQVVADLIKNNNDDK